MRTNVASKPTKFTHEGAPAKNINAEAELRRTVMACMLWEDNFYESGVSVADRISTLVKQLPPTTVASIAHEARSRMHLRHVPLHLMVGLARAGQLKAGMLADVIQRPDEITEFVSLYWSAGKCPLSKQVKKGLAQALGKFNEYSLAKYNGGSAKVRLRDVMFLTHPKPVGEEKVGLYQRLASDTLATPDTWEVELSKGQNKTESWSRLLAEKKLGGMALLRNLRNISAAGIGVPVIAEAMSTANFARVLPFRFIAAARAVPGLEHVIEPAMLRTASELTKLPGRTCVVVDNSGSMDCRLSGKSDMNRQDAANGLAILLREVCDDVVIIGFGSTAAVMPSRRGFALADAIKRGPGGGTNTQTALDLATKQGYDRIVVITDEQSHQRIGGPKAGAKGYFINVGVYQNGIGYGAWTHIDGWSEAIVDYIRESESGE